MPRPLKDWQEEIAAEMLDDLEKITGVSIGEMMADDLEETPERGAGEYETYPVYEEPTEDHDLDLDNPDGEDTDEYFDVLFDDIDVDADKEIDQYSED